MAPERWLRIEELFHVASALPRAERDTYLTTLCGSDTELRAEVRALLISLEEDGDDLLRGAVGQGAAAVVAQQEASGQRVGAYRLLRPLGRGGMGAVYLAVRADEQFEQQVAIKLIRTGYEQRRGVLRRFLNERQILANLEHPNITRLLDGGATADGTPYLVMEYVDGQPVDEYARAAALDARARLELMRSVCDPVRYAHRNMVIHRDLKPSNILVTSGGGVKLLDFGIAKITRQDPEQAGVTATRLGERALTPEYASPEMIRGEAIAAPADVYSLGVVLYELLTLTKPFPSQGKSAFETELAVMTAEAPAPSAVAGGLVAALSREQRLDLDAIIRQAMRKEAGDRYESVEAFAADIGRFLDGFPVKARPGDRRYRWRKFVRRNWVPVTAAAVFGVSVTALAIGMTVNATRAERERARSEEISRFLLSIFTSADPREARGERLTARDLLDRGVARVEKDLSGQPQVQSELLRTMGEAYQYLSLPEQAERVFARQLEVARRAHGERSREALDVMTQLADVQRTRGKYAEALAGLRRVESLQRALLGPDAMELAHTLNDQALVEQALGHLPEAATLAQDAIRIAGRYPEEAKERLTMQGNLAAILQDAGRPAEAEDLMRRVLDGRTRLLGKDHPQRVRSLLRLGRLLYENGAYGDAVALTEEAATLSAKVWGEDNLDHLQHRFLRAQIAAATGGPDEVRAVAKELVKRATPRVGTDQPQVLTWRLWSAEGLEDCRAVLAEVEKRGGPRSAAMASALGLAAAEALRERRGGEALEWAERAAAIERQMRSGPHARLAAALGQAGMALALLGRKAEAEKRLDEAWQMDQAVFARPHRQTALHLDALKRREEALVLQRRIREGVPASAVRPLEGPGAFQ